jgi:hypothetical protein
MAVEAVAFKKYIRKQVRSFYLVRKGTVEIEEMFWREV